MASFSPKERRESKCAAVHDDASVIQCLRVNFICGIEPLLPFYSWLFGLRFSSQFLNDIALSLAVFGALETKIN